MGYCLRSMPRLSLAAARLLAFLTGMVVVCPAAYAQQPATGEVQTQDQLKAQQHFQRARELYQGGSYREAIGELEAARALDPKAKDLVFNLGIVHEKLARFDEALEFFRTYLEMEGVTAAERGKAEGIIKRIEGAKREVPKVPPSGGGGEAPPEPPKERGRVDAATVAAGSLALVGAGVGTFFGVKALTSQPSNFVTGRDGSYETLKSQTDDAHTSAVVADVAFGVGIVAAIATAYLYFGRTKDTKAKAARPPLDARASVGTNGGFFVLGGTFQ